MSRSEHKGLEHREAFRLGECWIEPSTNQIGGTRVDAKAMDVLTALMEAAPQVLSAAALMDRVWPNVVVGDNVVHQAIAHLRRALGDRARESKYIEHVPRRGYRLIAPLKRALSAAQALDDAGGVHARGPRHNLPTPLTSFVGRVDEMAQVQELLEAHRLVTVTGVGGGGKTRFALELARGQLHNFSDGVWFVELAAIGAADLITQAIATALGMREVPGQALLETLLSSLSTKRLLLVLDNCEHLIEACARDVETLLQRVPHLKILATSREPLNVRGEHPWRILSLVAPGSQRLPPLDELGEIEAVQLFVDRAREIQPSFSVTPQNARAVAQICGRLDGIPLAIELAAALVRALTPEQIASRLNDRFRLLTGGSRTALPRQQTLQATLDWGHALLEEAERVLFRRLAVFAGGWTLEAAEAVAGVAPVPPSEIVDLIRRLIDKSWLQVAVDSSGTARYRMLETVREYGSARLLDAGEGEAFRVHHRNYFMQMVESAARELWTGDQLAALSRFGAERDNLQSALAWCAECDVAKGLQLVCSLWRYWMMRGLATEGRRWLEEFTARSTEVDESRALLASALLGAGWLARFQGDYETARQRLERSAALFSALEDRSGEAEALSNLGSNFVYMGEAESGERMAARALELARVAGDPYVIGYCLQTFGDHCAGRGEYERARPLLDEGVATLRSLGRKQSLAFALAKLGSLLLHQGELVAARAALEEAHALHEELGEGLGIDHTLVRLGWLAHHEGDDVDAQRLLERSLSFAEDAGFVPEAALVLSMLGRVFWQRGESERGVPLLKQALLRSCEVQAHDVIATCLEAFAIVAAHQREPARAVKLLGAANRIRVTAVRPLAPVELPEYNRVVRALRAALGKSAFRDAWQSGESMTLEEAIAETERTTTNR